MSGTQEKLCFTTQVLNTFVTQIIAYNNLSDMRWHIPIEQALEVSRLRIFGKYKKCCVTIKG